MESGGAKLETAPVINFDFIPLESTAFPIFVGPYLKKYWEFFYSVKTDVIRTKMSIKCDQLAFIASNVNK